MKVLVTGATGFVGKKLCVEILKKGWQLVVLTRDSKKAEKSLGLPAEFISWQDEEQDISKDVFDGVDSIVNLAGESISQKWTPEIKESLQLSLIHI